MKVEPVITSRTLSTLLAIVVAVALGSCDTLAYRPMGAGPNGEVTIVIDSTAWEGAAGDAIRQTIGEYIDTLPAPERWFDLAPTTIASSAVLEQVKTKKNLVFVADLSDSTTESGIVRQFFSEDALRAVEDGTPVVIFRRNVWRSHQRIAYLTAADSESLAQLIRDKGVSIRDTFNLIARERLARDMYEPGRQESIEDMLAERHEFSLRIQRDFQVAIDTTQFVWLRRILIDTWRDLFVYYDDQANPAEISPEWIVGKRDSLSKIYLRGNLGGYVATDTRRPLTTTNINFAGNYGYETRGLWQVVGEENGSIVQFGQGGPFINYTFYDQNTGRVYMIDGMVFAPGFEKREFLRQLEVIAHTFTAAPDESSALTSISSL